MTKHTSRFFALSFVVGTSVFAQSSQTQTSGPKPKNWDNVIKETYHEGVTVSNLTSTPVLVGRNLNDKSGIEKYLEGSKWTIKVISQKADSKAPKGEVLSQEPKEYSEVKQEGEIKVVVSSGK